MLMICRKTEHRKAHHREREDRVIELKKAGGENQMS